MTRSQFDTRGITDFTDPLTAVTRRGKLVHAKREGFLELDAAGERFELLGPFDNAAQPGDDVEITGVVAPQSRTARTAPAMLVRHVRRI
ncbi:hypothetical protein [Jiangella asiatica]|uniref:Uncharacterized protein n=1 Tax=Jiangella asiatica TaxID=2530372 RepID=A0A4R5DB91_9ACTN|nr:hypothetical protein [Jiangella asiatica]TDE10919.1 hypothetical protein E1269_10580 [Jiangella asiatica]